MYEWESRGTPMYQDISRKFSMPRKNYCSKMITLIQIEYFKNALTRREK
jgi:hypothetical protein